MAPQLPGSQSPEPRPMAPQLPGSQSPEPLRVRLQQVGTLWRALAPGALRRSTAALGPSRRADSAPARRAESVVVRQTDSALPRPLEARVWAPAQRAGSWEFARPWRWLWVWAPP